MIKGLCTSASGMIPHIRKQETAANNLANAGTPGFKKDIVFTRELSRAEKQFVPTKSDWQQPMVDDLYTDYSAGIFNRTGNTLDIAIEGDGFFTLLAPDGSTVLTRSGSFLVDNDGLLAFPGGMLVAGEGGPIEIGDGRVTVSLTGEIEVDGINVARIIPQTVADLNQLEKIGSSMFRVPEGVELITVEKASLRQGYLEASNVDIVSEMIDMIISYRNYEANARAIQSQDESLNHLFNRVVGR
ncbi:MAG: flagellar hook-basal body protein [candidate division Zixibacteria bacterium]|nr:flagellar hook-basal body protein [candidate division Zixibacteria bacterium]